MSEGSNDNNSQQSAASLLAKELFVLCKSESLSEEGLGEIIQRHRLTQNNNHLSDHKFFHAACRNERVTEGIIRCLLEYFPKTASYADNKGNVSLHFACNNKNMTVNIIQLVIDASPASVRSVNNNGNMPLHFICGNTKVDDAAAIQILNFLIEKYPEAVRHVDNKGQLPIHYAAGGQSPEFCRVLIEAYPGSERITTTKGVLPLHCACEHNSLAMVKYLYRQYPEAIDRTTTRELYPIHAAIKVKHRENPAAAVEIVQFLLNCDPNQELIQFKGKSLLQIARGQQYNDSNIEAGIEMIKVIFKAQPASSDGWSPLYYACSNKSVTLNIIERLIEEAPDSVRSVNNDGWMALHILCNHKHRDEMRSLNIMRFLIEEYPESVRHADNRGLLPIHIAAGLRSPEFCRVLIEAYPGSERITTTNGLLPLHFACEHNSLTTVEYMHGLYPDAINLPRTTAGWQYPIHMAMLGIKQRENPADAAEIVLFLLNCDPNQKLVQSQGKSLLHCACGMEYKDSKIEAAIEMIKTIYDARPEAISSVNNEGWMPLHILCYSNADEAAAMQILKFLLEKNSEAARRADNRGFLPIHIAAGLRSLEFCRVLINAYPGSERMTTTTGVLPLHYACAQNSLATVEYVCRLFPEAIDHASNGGNYPIHTAIAGMTKRKSPATAVKLVQFLLDFDPNQKLVQFQGASLLYTACVQKYNDSKIEAAVQTIKILFDAHPEAIEDNRIATDIQRYHQRIQAFINGELVYARQAKDLRLMMTPDDNGKPPLHTALQNNVRLGSIKLLVKGNPLAIRTCDNSFAFPLHIACQHHNSASVVQYLLDLDLSTHNAVDGEGNTVLHYACLGAKYDTIALLLKKYDAASVSKRNAHGKLPIDLLLGSNKVRDRASVEYMGSIYQLVRANPEMVAISSDLTVIQQVDANATRNGKKRKFSHDHEK